MKLTKKLISLVMVCTIVISLIGVLPASADENTPNFTIPEWTDDFSGHTTTYADNNTTATTAVTQVAPDLVTFAAEKYDITKGESLDTNTGVRMIAKDGSSDKVMAIGPMSSGWGTKWTFKNPVTDSFKIGFKLKVNEIDVAGSSTGQLLWQIRMTNNGVSDYMTLGMKMYSADGALDKYTIHIKNFENNSVKNIEYEIPADLINADSTTDWFLLEAEMRKDKTAVIYLDKEEIANVTLSADAFSVTVIDLAKRAAKTPDASTSVKGINSTTYFDDVTFYDATYGGTVSLPAIEAAKGSAVSMVASRDENGAAKAIKWENGTGADTSKLGNKTYKGKSEDTAYTQLVKVGTVPVDPIVAKDEMSHTDTSNGVTATTTGLNIAFKTTSTDASTATSVDLEGGNKALKFGPDKLASDHMTHRLVTPVTGDYSLSFKVKINNWQSTSKKGEAIKFTLYGDGGARMAGGYIQMPSAATSMSEYSYRSYYFKDADSRDQTHQDAISSFAPLTLISGSTTAYNTEEWFTIRYDVDSTADRFDVYINNKLVRGDIPAIATATTGEKDYSTNTDATNLYSFSITKRSAAADMNSEVYVDEIKITTPGTSVFYGDLPEETSLTVGQGSTASAAVSVPMTDGSSADVALTDVSVDTTKIGTRVYNGIPEGFDVPVTVNVKVCNYVVSDPVFKDSTGVVVLAPETDGKLESVKVKRYGTGYETATLVFAYFDGAAFKKAKVVSVSDIDAGSEDDVTVDLSLDTVGDNGVIKVFAFNNIGSISPIDLVTEIWFDSFFQ